MTRSGMPITQRRILPTRPARLGVRWIVRMASSGPGDCTATDRLIARNADEPATADAFALLASGFWLLASGFWLLASGFWLRARATSPDACRCRRTPA